MVLGRAGLSKLLKTIPAGGNDGAQPEDTGGVAVDAAGNVYGTTNGGGIRRGHCV